MSPVYHAIALFLGVLFGVAGQSFVFGLITWFAVAAFGILFTAVASLPDRTLVGLAVGLLLGDLIFGDDGDC